MREPCRAAKPIDDTGSKTIQTEVLNTVEKGATLYTDEHGAYTGLEELYKHEAVKHSAKAFVNHMAQNGIESVWAVLKRGYNGVYHHWSHMRRYVNEFVFRLRGHGTSLDHHPQFGGQAVDPRGNAERISRSRVISL